MSSSDKALGIDIGGTKMAVAAVDSKGRIAARTTLATEAELGFARAVDRLVAAADAVLAEAGWSREQLAGVGVGCTGPVSAERGIQRSKRTVLALSPAYLDDRWASFQNTLAQHLGVEEGTWRLLPVKVAPIEDDELPPRIAMLAPLDLTDPRRGSRNVERLIAALRGPLPEVDQ